MHYPTRIFPILKLSIVILIWKYSHHSHEKNGEKSGHKLIFVMLMLFHQHCLINKTKGKNHQILDLPRSVCPWTFFRTSVDHFWQKGEKILSPYRASLFCPFRAALTPGTKCVRLPWTPEGENRDWIQQNMPNQWGVKGEGRRWIERSEFQKQNKPIQHFCTTKFL